MSAQSDSSRSDSARLEGTELDSTESNSTVPDRTKVIVCQNKTCKQQGSEQVLSAFRRSVPADVLVEPSGCLGQCGNGPMTIVVTADTNPVTGAEAEPQKTWYSTVRPADAFAIAAHHFKKKDAVEDSASLPHSPLSESSSQRPFIWVWLVGLVLFLALCALMALVLGGPTHYG